MLFTTITVKQSKLFLFWKAKTLKHTIDPALGVSVEVEAVERTLAFDVIGCDHMPFSSDLFFEKRR